MYAGLFLAERLYFDPGKVIFEFDLVQKIDRNQHNHTNILSIFRKIIYPNLSNKFQVLYLYDSVFGYGLVIMRMVGWLMFIYATFFTLKHYPEKVPVFKF